MNRTSTKVEEAQQSSMNVNKQPTSLSSRNGHLDLYDTSEETIEKVALEFIQLVGSQYVTVKLDERRLRSITKWSPASPSHIPNLVVLPQSTAEVSEILRVCSRNRIPVLGYCGGTSMPGAIAATRGGVCVDFNRMNKIVEVHKEDMDVVVQPAVNWQDLNSHLEEYDLFFPPDPGPGAKIGGMVRLRENSSSVAATADQNRRSP